MSLASAQAGRYVADGLIACTQGDPDLGAARIPRRRAAKLNFNISCILGARLAEMVESAQAEDATRV